ncbi:hypothetical protein MMC25_005610 [Agyrium rufum]|nr:hypothetical protein [Agyrium rufum]
MESTTSYDPFLTTTKRFQHLRGFFFRILMASSDVDQKYLGRLAKDTSHHDPILSAMLFEVLGLSVVLSKKLVRARRLRKMDASRDPKAMQLYNHIIWLSREGLVIVRNTILPNVQHYKELRVLAHKLQASFYHIFVLFHNQPSIHASAVPVPQPTSPTKRKPSTGPSSVLSTPGFPSPLKGNFPQNIAPLPPGLAPVSIPKPSASFLLPAIDYIPTASSCFSEAALLSDKLLSGSHPIRLSVKLEYAAYLYDCLHDGEASRKLTKQSILDVYNAKEGMEDDMFEDAAELVAIMGKMMRRVEEKGATPASTPEHRALGPRTMEERVRQQEENPMPPALFSPSKANVL